MVPRPHISAMEHNTVYVQIFTGCLFYKCPIGDFTILFLERTILPEDFMNRVGYHCSSHTAVGEVLVHLPSDLSRYCHFGETLLMPS